MMDDYGFEVGDTCWVYVNPSEIRSTEGICVFKGRIVERRVSIAEEFESAGNVIGAHSVEYMWDSDADGVLAGPWITRHPLRTRDEAIEYAGKRLQNLHENAEYWRIRIRELMRNLEPGL